MVVFLLTTTWPGAQLFNSVLPLVFGLPFNLFFIALMVSLALLMLALLYFSERRSGD